MKNNTAIIVDITKHILMAMEVLGYNIELLKAPVVQAADPMTAIINPTSTGAHEQVRSRVSINGKQFSIWQAWDLHAGAEGVGIEFLSYPDSEYTCFIDNRYLHGHTSKLLAKYILIELGIADYDDEIMETYYCM